MRDDLPTSVNETLHDLTVEPLVSLFKVTFKDLTEMFLSPQEEVTWQGDLYETLPCQITELSYSSDGKLNRPNFSIVNPAGLFSQAVANGVVEGATLKRIRILKSDLEADNDFSVQEQFKVSRVQSLTKDLLVVELRSALDGQNFKLPARAFYPPEFPHVKLS